jgi:hypothetical protein
MRTIYITIPFITLLLIACKKTPKPVIDDETPVTTEMKQGLPPDMNAINGYFYSAYKITASNNSTNTTMYGFAGFGEPARRISANYDPYYDNTIFPITKNQANVHVGEITLNDSYMMSHSSFNNQNPPFLYNFYQNLYNYSLTATPPSPSWKTEGNGSFKPVDVTLPIKYPALQFPVLNSVSKTSTLTVNLNQVFPNGYDSAMVALTDYNYSYGSIKKLVARGDSIVRFIPSDMYIFGTSSYGYIQVHGYNYCHQEIQGKMHVFALGSKYMKYVNITP